MAIRDAISVINRMEADGIIERYAIGGAVGATFYIEPLETLDIDIFVEFPTNPGSPILDPKPFFDYLGSSGYAAKGDYIEIAGWPVQFLPPTGPLAAEALENAVEVDVEGVRARVFRAEYLAALALQVNRAKDKTRLIQFHESGILDEPRFESILRHHRLFDQWQEFERKFLGE